MNMLCLKKNCYNHSLFPFLCKKEQTVEKILKKRSIDETLEIKSFMFTAKYDLNY